MRTDVKNDAHTRRRRSQTRAEQKTTIPVHMAAAPGARVSGPAFVMGAPAPRARPDTKPDGAVPSPSHAGGGADPAGWVAFVIGLALTAFVAGGLFATLAAPAELAPVVEAAP